MSVITAPKKYSLEIKLKFSKILHSFDNLYFQIFPANTPGYYKNPLGMKDAISWYDRIERKNIFQMLAISLFATPIGIWGVTQNQIDVFAWLFLLWGTSSSILLFLHQISSNDEQKKINKKLRYDLDVLRREFNNFKNSKSS